MKMMLFIACGGAVGAVMRFAASQGVYSLLGRGFPYGTLFVNVTGSFLMGLLGIMLIERFNVTPELRAAIFVGVLGSFTTFSTFSYETLNLLEHGDMMKAFANIALSIIVCLAAIWVGVSLGRQL